MKRILIVEDDPFVLRSFSQTLAKHDFEVETSQSGAQALEKLKQVKFDLALIDVCLPDMDGTELLSRAKKYLEKTVKIMVTGFPSVELSDKAKVEGAETYVVKPIKPPELLALVNLYVR